DRSPGPPSSFSIYRSCVWPRRHRPAHKDRLHTISGEAQSVVSRSIPSPAAAMTGPTTADNSTNTTPIVKMVQCGCGIRPRPPTVKPTKATTTAVHAAGDDPCDMNISSDERSAPSLVVPPAGRACRVAAALSDYSVGSRPSSCACQISASESACAGWPCAAGASYRRPIVAHEPAHQMTNAPATAATANPATARAG